MQGMKVTIATYEKQLADQKNVLGQYAKGQEVNEADLSRLDETIIEQVQTDDPIAEQLADMKHINEEYETELA